MLSPSVCTIPFFSRNSISLVPRLLLLHYKTSPNIAIISYVPSSKSRCFCSATTPIPDSPPPTPTDDAAKTNISSMAKKYSFFSIFQDWKWNNKPNVEKEKEVEPCGGVVVDKPKKKTPPPPSAIDLALNTVVKVFTVSSEPRLFQPWQITMQSECSGSGFVISGKKIITNAHVVEKHTSVKVRKHGSSTKYKAKVKAIGNKCDLAILEINSDEFWEGMKFLELGDVPLQQESVAVVGYPCGGDSICVTKGVVSRVEPGRYSHSSAELLTIQIDAAINSGNSGGPVIKGDKVVGVAFQSLFWSDNIGYIIPTPVINHFLKGVEESGQHVDFCSMNISYQTMENAQIRNYFKMTKDTTGILINRINPLSDSHKFLKKNDVLLSIDGVSIENDSTIPFRNQERVSFKHLVSMKKQSETALIKVLREGKEHEFNISLKPVQPLVPRNLFDKLRSYYIFGGFVFVPLSQPYIDSSYDISDSLSRKIPKKAGEQIIIISQILEDDINTGYDIFEDLQVKKVNGVEVDNMKHLCELIEECCAGDVMLDLGKDKVLVLNIKSAKKATLKILKEFEIPSAMSKDLQPRHSKKKNYN
ncbi:unnamed protein product [Cochlearia groenlandica]